MTATNVVSMRGYVAGGERAALRRTLEEAPAPDTGWRPLMDIASTLAGRRSIRTPSAARSAFLRLAERGAREHAGELLLAAALSSAVPSIPDLAAAVDAIDSFNDHILSTRALFEISNCDLRNGRTTMPCEIIPALSQKVIRGMVERQNIAAFEITRTASALQRLGEYSIANQLLLAALEGLLLRAEDRGLGAADEDIALVKRALGVPLSRPV